MIPSVVALSWIASTTVYDVVDRLRGKSFCSSRDEVARLVGAARRSRAARARGRSAGRTRAARSRRSSPRGAVPRSAKNFATVRRTAGSTPRVSGSVSVTLRCRRASRGSRRSDARSPPQVEAAVLVDATGAVVASTLADERAAGGSRGRRVDLLEAPRRARRARAAARDQLEAALREGSVFVVRDGDGRHRRDARAPRPTVGLVFYDLRTCLRALDATKKKPKPRSRRGARRPRTPMRRLLWLALVLGARSLASEAPPRGRAASASTSTTTTARSVTLARRTRPEARAAASRWRSRPRAA